LKSVPSFFIHILQNHSRGKNRDLTIAIEQSYATQKFKGMFFKFFLAIIPLALDISWGIITSQCIGSFLAFGPYCLISQL
jgi:hypothetical protein